MPPGPKIASRSDAAAALVAVGPLVALWLERLLSGHDPPLTAGQFLALGAIDRGPVSAAELARRTGVSGPAVSQLLAALGRNGLIERSPAQDDRRRRCWRSRPAAGGFSAPPPRSSRSASGRSSSRFPPPRPPPSPARCPPW